MLKAELYHRYLEAGADIWEKAVAAAASIRVNGVLVDLRAGLSDPQLSGDPPPGTTVALCFDDGSHLSVQALGDGYSSATWGLCVERDATASDA